MTETSIVEKPSCVSLRSFSRGEESTLLDILKDAFGSFADVPRARAALSSRRFDADGCSVAAENEAPIGCGAPTRLRRDYWSVIRNLTIRRATSKPQSPKHFSPTPLLLLTRGDLYS